MATCQTDGRCKVASTVSGAAVHVLAIKQLGRTGGACVSDVIKETPAIMWTATLDEVRAPVHKLQRHRVCCSQFRRCAAEYGNSVT